MALLAFDTSSESCSVALQTEQGCLEKIHAEPRKQAEYLLPMINELLLEAGIKRTDLTGLALTYGPGAFTGVRIAAAAAQGLAFALDIPIVMVSTLQALAQGAYRKLAWPRVISALDARMGEVYWGCYELDETHLMQPIVPDAVAQPQDVIIPPQSRIGWYGAGSGWFSYAEDLPRVNETHNLIVEAIDILHLANPLFKKGLTVTSDKVSPLYLRSPVSIVPFTN